MQTTHSAPVVRDIRQKKFITQGDEVQYKVKTYSTKQQSSFTMKQSHTNLFHFCVIEILNILLCTDTELGISW